MYDVLYVTRTRGFNSMFTIPNSCSLFLLLVFGRDLHAGFLWSIANVGSGHLASCSWGRVGFPLVFQHYAEVEGQL